MSAPSPRCGRLEDHDAHDWTRPSLLGIPAAVHHCVGEVEVAEVERPSAGQFSAWVGEGWDE